MLKGSIVALVTPFDEDNNINYQEVDKIIKYQMDNGTDGILLLGTTGEAESLSDSEKYELVKHVCDYVDDKLPIMVGIISNQTKKVVELAKMYENLKIDSYLVIAPYYIKTNESGMIKHFTYIADHVNRPIVLYNVPKRTGINLSFDVVRILSYHKNIIGIKEASSDLIYQSKIASICREDFVLYGADDQTMIPSLAIGASGIISVINNAFPKEIKLIVDSAPKDLKIANTVFNKLITIMQDIFIETSPIPIKYLMYLQGFETLKLRLPLAECSMSLKRKLEEDYLNIVN